VAEDEEPARLKRIVEAAQNCEAALFGEIHEHVHAEDAVQLAHVRRFGEIHLRERNHFSCARADLVAELRRFEMRVHMARIEVLHAALGVMAALGVAQGAAADVRGDNFDFPGFGEFQRIGNGDSDGVRLFTRGAAGAPDAQRARALPDFALLHFGQNFPMQRFVHRRIAEERRFLSEQALEKRFVLDA
jgi:hypothetical protein